MNDFGLGDNQLGAELSGHSIDSYTRYGIAVLSSTSGTPGFPAGKSYDAYLTLSQAFAAGANLHRIGGFAYFGRRPTVFETADGDPIPGNAVNTEPFYRIGVTGSFFFGPLELLPLVMHASDDAHLATATPGGTPLPAGAHNAIWNAGLLEAHYFVNPQLVFIGRAEGIRMSHQGLNSMPKKQGNTDVYTIGTRIYPIMFSRDGLSVHTELSFSKTVGMAPASEDGSGLDPLTPTTEVWSTSVLFALDFAF